MNTQNTQDLRIGMQAEALCLCDSMVDRLLAKTVALINNFRNYYAHRAMTALLLKIPSKHLRDVGLDDPTIQVRLTGSNLNTEASLREMNRNKLLMR